MNQTLTITAEALAALVNEAVTKAVAAVCTVIPEVPKALNTSCVLPVGAIAQATVGKGVEMRPRVPKALFENFSTIALAVAGIALTYVNEGTDGRSRLPKSVLEGLGAKGGDKVVFFPTDAAGHFRVEIGKNATGVAPKASASAPHESPRPAQVTPKVAEPKATVAEVAQFFKDGVVNENYPVGDPRRSMTRKQRKSFNRSPQGKALFAAGAIAVSHGGNSPVAKAKQAGAPKHVISAVRQVANGELIFPGVQ